MATKRIPEGASATYKPVVPRKPMPARSNAGGALRGRARAAAVKALKPVPPGQRRLPGKQPTTSATNPPPPAVKAAIQRKNAVVRPIMGGVGTPKQGIPAKTIGTGPNPTVPPVAPKVPTANGLGPAWLRRPGPSGGLKQAM